MVAGCVVGRNFLPLGIAKLMVSRFPCWLNFGLWHVIGSVLTLSCVDFAPVHFFLGATFCWCYHACPLERPACPDDPFLRGFAYLCDWMRFLRDLAIHGPGSPNDFWDYGYHLIWIIACCILIGLFLSTCLWLAVHLHTVTLPHSVGLQWNPFHLGVQASSLSHQLPSAARWSGCSTCTLLSDRRGGDSGWNGLKTFRQSLEPQWNLWCCIVIFDMIWGD